jgi:hypothetical protein
MWCWLACRLLLKIVYFLRCRVLGLAVLVFGGDLAKDAEPTPEPVRAGGEEATLKACGVGVAMLPGYSWTPAWPNDAQ